MATEKKPVVNKKEEKRTVINLLAKAFGLPPQGITLEESMGNKPYINSIGLEAARINYPKATEIDEVTFVKMYEKIGDTAIVTVKGVYERGVDPADKRLEIGTAGAANLDLGKNYPNEMAITRAVNRFLRRGLLPYLYKTYEENIKTFTKEEIGLLSEYVAEFGRVSAEELSVISQEQQAPEVFLTNEEMLVIKPYLENMIAAETEDDLDAIGKEIRSKKETLNEKQIEKLRETFTKIKKDKNWI